MRFDPCAGGMNDRINDVQKHRRANPTVYPPTDAQYLDSGFIYQQIVDFMCNQKPELCGEAPKYPAQKINVIETPLFACLKCGNTDWKAIMCPTCGTSRITGWECKSCGAKI